MKKIVIPILLLFGSKSFSQKFYVSGRDPKSVTHVVEKIKFEGYTTTADSLNSDYTVQLLVDGHYSFVKVSYKGYVKILNTKTGDEVVRSKIIKRNPAALNGYNASFDIFRIISKKYLPDELKKCKS